LVFGISLEPGVWILEFLSGIHDRQWPIKNREADDFGFGDVRAVSDAAGSEEKCAVGVSDSRFFPLAGKDVHELVGLGVDVGGDGHSREEFSQHRDAAGLFVFVERHEFNAGIRTGLPLFVFGQCNVWKHVAIEALCRPEDNQFIV